MFGLVLQTVTAIFLTFGACALLYFPIWMIAHKPLKYWFDTVSVAFVVFALGLIIAFMAWRLWRTLSSPPGTRLLPSGFYSFLIRLSVPEGHFNIVVPIDSPCDRLAELLLWSAAAARADKIVFGDPGDDLPRAEAAPPDSSHLSDKDRELLMQVDAILDEPPPVPVEPQIVCDLPGGKLPVWERRNQQWHPCAPLPVNLLPDVIRSLERILGRSFDLNDPAQLLVLRQMPLKTRVQATLRMEKNCCYSVALHYLDEP